MCPGGSIGAAAEVRPGKANTVDDLTKARAQALIANGATQRAAAAELGISRASLRRACGTPGVDARQAPPSSNGALHREPPPALTVIDLDGTDTAEDDDRAEGEWSTRKALTVLVAVAVLGLVTWLVYRRRAEGVD